MKLNMCRVALFSAFALAVTVKHIAVAYEPPIASDGVLASESGQPTPCCEGADPLSTPEPSLDREVGLAMAVPPERYETAGEPGIYDENGRTNEVVVRFDPADRDYVAIQLNLNELPDSSAALEEAIINLPINVQSFGPSNSSSFLGNPTHIRPLLGEARLDSLTRALLDPDSATERLQQFLVLRYASVEEAIATASSLKEQRGVLQANVSTMYEVLLTPNDPYYQAKPDPFHFQWGLHAMQFEQAWDISLGHAHISAIDLGFDGERFDNGVLVKYRHVPPDIEGTSLPLSNYREQLSKKVVFNPAWMPSYIEPASDPARVHNSSQFNFHGSHVSGIMAAVGNNATGVAGACPNCSFVHGAFTGGLDSANVAAWIWTLHNRGMQVINMSFGNDRDNTCEGEGVLPGPGATDPICFAIDAAYERGVVMVAAAGNFVRKTDFPARHSKILAVAGAQPPPAPVTAETLPMMWQLWRTGAGNPEIGSAHAGVDGVVAPARGVVSTVFPNQRYFRGSPFQCSDESSFDMSGIGGDGFASCTGTSMAAPHISGLAGLIKSINPLLTSEQVMEIIRTSGDRGAPTAEAGHGLVNATMSAMQALATNSSRLTPLFSFFSNKRRDYFYTSNIQMASAAVSGTLEPVNAPTYQSRYEPAMGNAVTMLSEFPGVLGDQVASPGSTPPSPVPLANAWIFTTQLNPMNPTVPLAPLYRMSWKCSDPTAFPPAVCASSANHVDTLHTTSIDEVRFFAGNPGYRLDGVEGYIYPRANSAPPGTVKMLRRYNRSLDDHAIFPEGQLNDYLALGYNQVSGLDYIGYVYPNNNGVPPL